METKLYTSDVWTVLQPFVKMQLTGLPPSPDEVLKILDIVIHLVEGKEDGVILSQIDANVRRLIEMPMKTAQDHLRNALAASDENNKRTWLYEAVNEFTHAKNVDFPPQNVRAMTYIALCFQCLGEVALSASWYQDSYAEAIRQWQECRRAVANFERPPILEKIAFTVFIIPVVFLASASVVGVFPLARIGNNASNAHYLALITLFDLEKQIVYLRDCIAPDKQSPLPDLYFAKDICRLIRPTVKAPGDDALSRALWNQNDTFLQCLDTNDKVVRSINLTVIGRYWKSASRPRRNVS